MTRGSQVDQPTPCADQRRNPVDEDVSSGIGGQRFHNAGITSVEIIVVAGTEMHRSVGFDRESSIAIEIQLHSQSWPSGSFSVRSKSMGSMKAALAFLSAI